MSQTVRFFSAINKVDIFVDTFEEQFSLNPGLDLSEVVDSIQVISSVPFSNYVFTTPGSMDSLIQKLSKRKASGKI